MSTQGAREKGLRYLSVCSGIEAASVAWAPLGWTPFGFAEIEAFPSAVLAHHYGSNLPGEAWSGNAPPNFGDVNDFRTWPDAAIDVLAGGTPCQSFSVAGLRKGLADPRGNLALTYLAVLDRYRPQWCVWENVPGVLSSSEGRDFGSFLGGLGQLGYGFAYRVIDAQYVRVDGFGRAVPQRRRRVFVVGNSRDWRRAAAVLFEPESLSGDSPPSRQARQGVATSPAPSAGDRRWPADIASTLNAHYGDKWGLEDQHINEGGPLFVPIDIKSEADFLVPVPAIAFDTTQITSKTNRSQPRAGDPCHPIAAKGHPPAVAFDWRASPSRTMNPSEVSDALSGRADRAVAFNITPSNSNKDYNARASDHSQAITGNGNRPSARGGDLIANSWAVRRLTPRECERLQGFPDDFTLIPYRGKLATDSPRYKALGNSMAVNCMRWIGRRIDLVDDLVSEAAALTPTPQTIGDAARGEPGDG